MNWLNEFYRKLDQLNIRQGQFTSLVVIALVVILAIGTLGIVLIIFTIVITFLVIKKFYSSPNQGKIDRNVSNLFKSISHKVDSEESIIKESVDVKESEDLSKAPPLVKQSNDETLVNKNQSKLFVSPAFNYAKPLPLLGRKKELLMLTQAWDKNKNTVVLIAPSGSGKTMLVNDWVNSLYKKDNKYHAKKIIRWSFTSVRSIDAFFDSNLNRLGYKDMPIFSAEKRGEKLAKLIAQQRILLILENLESVQVEVNEAQSHYSLSTSLNTLLQHLSKNNLGLCLLTSQQSIVELEGKEQVINHHLKPLSITTGLELLSYFSLYSSLTRANKVNELSKLIELTKGHALTLNLLASYLKNYANGDIQQATKLPALFPHKRKSLLDKVLEAYEVQLNNTPALSLLYMMALFENNAPHEAILLLCQAKIPHLTESLDETVNWEAILHQLHELGLIMPFQVNAQNQLTTHSLIRRYFVQRLQILPDESIQKANEVLYYYYLSLNKGQPSNLKAMQPLFTAISHGCLANQHQKVLDEVYWPQILREGKRYLARKLGAFETELYVLSHFFSQPWSQVTSHLKNEDKLVILNWAITRLQGLGQEKNITEAMNAELALQIEQKNWKNASSSAHKLSQRCLKQGNLQLALKAAKQSASYADKTMDNFQRMNKRSALAHIQHQLGHWDDALTNFEKSERWQIKWQPNLPMLYSVWGARYCYYLLDKKALESVEMRAEYALKVVMSRSRNLLDIALNNLLLGHVCLERIAQGHLSSPNTAKKWLKLALTNFQQLNKPHEFPPVLLAMACYYRYCLSYIAIDEQDRKNIKFNQTIAVKPILLNSIPHQETYQIALNYLEEAKAIINDENNPLQWIDYHLEITRLLFTISPPKIDDITENIRQARILIEKTGYKKCLNDLIYLENHLATISSTVCTHIEATNG